MKYVKNFRQALSAIIDDLEIRCPHWTSETIKTNHVLRVDIWWAYVPVYGIEAVAAAIKFLEEH